VFRDAILPLHKSQKRSKVDFTLLLFSFKGYVFSFLAPKKNKTLSFVGNGQFFSAFLSASSQNSTSICCGHALTETVLIGSLSA
jgi:hypothetical protein